MSADEPRELDATPLLYMPLDELQSLFSSIQPGSSAGRAHAQLLHVLAAVLTGEHFGADGSRGRFWPPGQEAEALARRAVDFLELADRLDGIGLAEGGHKESL